MGTHTPKEIKKRLKENYALFEKVKNVQDYEGKEQMLEKYFDDKGVNALKKEDWFDVDFSKVKKSNESNKSEDKVLKYIGSSDKALTSGRKFWEREQQDTTAGRRKRHIIVFNHNIEEEIKLRFEFDDILSKSFIDSRSLEHVSVSGQKLFITLKPTQRTSTFYKLSYTHNGQSKSKYEFNIAVINIEEKYLDSIKAVYEISTAKKSGRIQINNDGHVVKLGLGQTESEVEIDKSDDIVEIKEDETIKISNYSDAWDEGSLKFILETSTGTVPIEISEKESRSKPASLVRLAKLKRENRESFKWENNKIRLGTSEFYLDDKLRNIFNMEKQLVEDGIVYGEKELENILKINLDLSEGLFNSYESLIDYFRTLDNIPSLTYMDDKLIELYRNYIEIYNKEIEEIEETSILITNKKKLNLLKLGCIKDGTKIMMTPLSPLSVAYQLEVYKQLRNEDIETHILERLKPNNLLPYIYGEDNELLRPIFQSENVEWIIYDKSKKVSIGQTNAFMAKVVREKLDQFINHFKYLFPKNSYAPIKINLININNDREIVKGIFEYIKKQIYSNVQKIIPVEINIFNEYNTTAFDEFFSYSTIEKLEEAFDISLGGSNNDIDKIDVIRLVLANIKYYKYGNSKDYGYAHVSFYKIGQDDKYAKDTSSNMESGLSLDGLLSTLTSNRNGDNYRTGFGSKNILEKDSTLIRTALNLNEFAVNLDNGGEDPYRKDTSIVTKPLVLSEETMHKLYDSSHWVTFIEPNFGLEYFEKTNGTDLVVIHYSDQFNTAEQYDTITVTNKVNQYIYIIREFLRKKDIEITDEEAYRVIKSFNSINGDWLLNLISNKSEYDREKLSIIAAIKYGLAILNHKDILWIPVSLEEILRVSNAVRLNKSEGLFSLKNLKYKGIHSDDLIFIGVNIKDKERLRVYYYPVEVKIGYNFENVIEKGMNQIDKTYKLIKEQLSQFTYNGRKAFKNKFYRNFFIQLLVANEQKLLANEIWNKKNLEQIEDIKKFLLNDVYEVSFELEKYIGKGALISFKKDNHWRSIGKFEDKLFIDLTEYDAYSGVKRDLQEIYNQIHNVNSDLDVYELLENVNIVTSEIISNKEIITPKEIKETSSCEEETKSLSAATKVLIENSLDVACSGNQDENEIVEKRLQLILKRIEDNSKKDNSTKKDNSANKEETNAGLQDLNIKDINLVNKDKRVLLGEAEGSTKKIYWEFGNKGLSNRHMLITGKSGQGKTYFIQCALKELIDQQVPSIIIDYTEGFKSSQLEPEFKKYVGDRLQQYLVAKDKFPLNPFEKWKKELDDDYYVDEDYVDVAERFKSVIGAVYSDLGAQQLNSIYQAVIRGLERYNGKLNLRAFRDELSEDKSSYAQTALAQLNLLIDKNPFEINKEFDWSKLDKEGGKIFIIQLTGFTKDVQKIITEIILWDLWNYKLQNGSKEKPFVVVLDEAQNLNFKDNSPSTRILTEGRKFGWSAWFATQFLKGQMDKATISRLQNSGQKIYFAQTEEEAISMASALAADNEERKLWTKKLINLEKGNCISYGPIVGGEGNLISSKPVKIKIAQLKERINKDL